MTKHATRTRLGIASIAAAVTLGAGGAVWAAHVPQVTIAAPPSATSSSAATPSTAVPSTEPAPTVLGSRRGGYAGSSGSASGSASTGSTGSSGTSTSSTAVSAPTQATATQLVGVVNIITNVDYGQAEAAGTGIVLTSNGEILTNNHVVEGATEIQVTDLTTNKTYTATVVGTSATNDIAVLKLKGASGLQVATLGDSATATVGESVVGVGNAGNAPGTSAAAGTITALGQSITAADESGANAEQLTGLIKTSADIQAGDSGGPLYGATGTVIGIDTAAETTGGTVRRGSSSSEGATVAGYAIPIDQALSVAQQITSGVSSSTIQQGLPAFLGIEEPAQQVGTRGVAVSGVISGSAAAKAGLAAGDTITAAGGETVTSASALQSVISSHKPGDKVSVSWLDASGANHTATITLGSGPAA